MKVSCEHMPLLITGFTAVPVPAQGSSSHLANLFPRLIPFHDSLPNFPFQASFPTPRFPSKFLFPSLNLSSQLTTTQVPFYLWPVPNFFSSRSSSLSGVAAFLPTSQSNPSAFQLPSFRCYSQETIEPPSPSGSLLRACCGFLFAFDYPAFPSAFPPVSYRLAWCHPKAAGSGNCRESPARLL